MQVKNAVVYLGRMATAHEIVSVLLEDNGELDAREHNLAAHTRHHFINNHVTGYRKKDGSMSPPISREDAEQRWNKVSPQFNSKLKTDPNIRRNYGLQQQQARA